MSAASDDELAQVLARARERAEDAHRATEEHRRTCRERRCDQCGRFPCARGGCTDVVSVDGDRCPDCRLEAVIGIDAGFREPFRGRELDRRLALSTFTSAEIASALAWAEGELTPRPLVLLGDTGLGKTALVNAMLGAWARRYSGTSVVRGARYVSSKRLVQHVNRAFGSREYEEGERLVDEAVHATHFVFDDIGNETGDRRHRDVVDRVVRLRYDRGAPMWITTFLDQIAMEEHFDGGAALVRSIYEPASLRGLIVQFRARKRPEAA